MPTFNPDHVRKAVAEFSPRRPQKFQDLLPATEVIAELRQKKASYEAIADLLTQHCLPTSKRPSPNFVTPYWAKSFVRTGAVGADASCPSPFLPGRIILQHLRQNNLYPPAPKPLPIPATVKPLYPLAVRASHKSGSQNNHSHETSRLDSQW